MARNSILLGLVALLLVGLLGTSAPASKYASRQYYGNWRKHDKQGYYYRPYYYKPRDDYSGYKHHYVFYFPSKPDHYYYYNPHKKQWWGRCPVKHDNGKGTYSMLAEEDRKENFDDVDEKKFPKPGPMPSIPESSDNATLDLPPDDLPTSEGLPRDRK